MPMTARGNGDLIWYGAKCPKVWQPIGAQPISAKTPQENEMTQLQAVSSIVVEVKSFKPSSLCTVKLALSKKQSFVFITLFLSAIMMT